MKPLRSFCSVDVGVDGYVAAMECRSVQVLRPRVSTSAGQSLAGLECFAFSVDLAWDVHAEKAAPDVQERQLRNSRLEQWADGSSLDEVRKEAHGLPSFPSTTPCGCFCDGSVVVPPTAAGAAAAVSVSRVSSVIEPRQRSKGATARRKSAKSRGLGRLYHSGINLSSQRRQAAVQPIRSPLIDKSSGRFCNC